MSDWEEALAGLGTAEFEKRVQEEAKESGSEVYKEAERTEVDKRIQPEIKMTTRDLAVAKKLVPERYKNAEFDADRIEEAFKEDMKRLHNMYSVEKFSRYKEVCYGILTTLRTGNLPDRSWLIGAPNGFGKTTFANECIMIMEEKNMRTVPYISLLELAEIRIAEEKRILRGIDSRNMNDNGYTELGKMPVDVTGCYSWSEYMNSECLVCYFTDVASRNIESRTLYQILSIRAAKALPTIVMIATSLKPYVNDITLRDQVWSEILGVENLKYGYDMLTHVSCYKLRRNAIMNAEEGM